MNLVQTALRRPLTILVLVIAVALGAGIALPRMRRGSRFNKVSVPGRKQNNTGR